MIFLQFVRFSCLWKNEFFFSKHRKGHEISHKLNCKLK